MSTPLKIPRKSLTPLHHESKTLTLRFPIRSSRKNLLVSKTSRTDPLLIIPSPRISPTTQRDILRIVRESHDILLPIRHQDGRKNWKFAENVDRLVFAFLLDGPAD